MENESIVFDSVETVNDKIETLLSQVSFLNEKIEKRLDVVTVNSTEYTVYLLENLVEDLKKALKNLKKGK